MSRLVSTLLLVCLLAFATRLIAQQAMVSTGTLSGDGNTVVLVTFDQSGVVTLLLYDRLTGSLEAINVDENGAPGRTVLNPPIVTTDGSAVVFETLDTLVAADTNNSQDMYRYDRNTGTLESLSFDNNGDPLPLTFAGSISGDGSTVGFLTFGDFGPADMNEPSDQDLVVRRLDNTFFDLAGFDDSGAQLNGVAFPIFNETGTLMAFDHAESFNGRHDVFVRDLLAGTTELVSRDPAGDPILSSRLFLGDMSADGRFVVFQTDRSVIPPDDNIHRDLYLRDRQLATTVLLTPDFNNEQANGSTTLSTLSGDGTVIAFTSQASDLVPGDTNGWGDTFFHDLGLGTNTRILAFDGAEPNGDTQPLGVSDDGQLILLIGEADNMAPGSVDCEKPSGTFRPCNMYLFSRAGGTIEVIPPPQRLKEILASLTPQSGDRFAQAVAVDGARIAIGVPNDDTTGPDAGKVSIFRFEGPQLVLEQDIPVPDGFSALGFGISLDLDGDLLIVGAAGAPVAPKGTTLAAAIFERVQGDWRIKVPLTPTGGSGNDEFGAAVALNGDTAVVGAPGDDEGEAGASGATYVFDAGGLLVGKIKPVVSTPGARFGASVATNGSTVAIGAPSSSISMAVSGSVSLYSRIASNLALTNDPFSASSADGDQFGASLSMHGGQLIVGAPGQDVNADADAGAAYIYPLEASQVGTPVELQPADPEAGAAFGTAVGVSGSGAAVGAPGALVDSMPIGAAYRFDLMGLQQEKLFARGGQTGLGFSIDLDGDRLVVGAPDSNDATGLATFQTSAQTLHQSGFE